MSGAVARGAVGGLTHGFAAEAVVAQAGSTNVVEMFTDAVKTFGDRNAFMFKEGADATAWTHMTFSEAGARVEALGNGLLELGVQKGDRVGILAGPRVEWGLTDYAALGTGAVVVPVYHTNDAAGVLHVLNDTNMSTIIVEDAAQLAKLNEIRAQLPGLKHVIVMQPSVETAGVTTLAEVEALGRGAANQGAWRDAAGKVGSEDLATIIYTSGSTGLPKGAQLSHGNYTGVVDALAGADNLFRPDDRVAMFLPLAHTFARSINFAGAKVGMEVAYSTPATIIDDLATMQPTILPSVPRIFEKANARILENIGAQTGVKALLGNWSLKTARAAADAREAGTDLSLALRIKEKLAHLPGLAPAKVRDVFGGRVRMAFSGGAPLDPEIQRFFGANRVPIYNAYGMTEAPAISMNVPGATRMGTVGRVVPNTEVKLLPLEGSTDTEILIRGPQVYKGYQGTSADIIKKNADTVDADGWLHTGDLGTMDADGFLTITGRAKDLIKTAGGEYVQPAAFESAMKSNELISQAVMYGDSKPYVTALVTLNEETVKAFAKQHGIAGDSIEQLATDPKIAAAIEQSVGEYNAGKRSFEQVKYYRVLDGDLSADLGEITPTLKVKRQDVSKKFAPLLDEMYKLGEGSPMGGVIRRADLPA